MIHDDTVGFPVKLQKQMISNDSHSEDCRAGGEMRIQLSERKLGKADGMYNIPDSIDACNDEIALMFGVPE